MYNSDNQYRCTIIRGKSQKDVDNLLPAYAKIIHEICPCSKATFEVQFNNKLSALLPGTPTAKTLNNHRTEVAGKLFGMYYVAHSDYDGEYYVYVSERTLKFLEDRDQPAFFKDVCFKMQFPNGMTKGETVLERINLNISVRPCCFVIEVLREAASRNMELTKNDIGYYVLNSLDALTRAASPFEIVDAIQIDRMNGIYFHNIGDPNKESSYNLQHINEQINYMELANLIIVTEDGTVRLNTKEEVAIRAFSSHWDDDPMFDVRAYDLSSIQGRQYFQQAWDEYYSTLSGDACNFATSVAALLHDEQPEENDSDFGLGGENTTELGDEGERYVFEYEKKRVSNFNIKLVNKVLSLGKTKGLGYDIQTVIAEPGPESEFVRYIEVKSTKRVTAPDINDPLWIDTINVTRNEWMAAQRHGRFYAIYRVYFVRGGVVMYVIENPYQLYDDNVIDVTPTTYKIEFGNEAINRVVNQ